MLEDLIQTETCEDAHICGHLRISGAVGELDALSVYIKAKQKERIHSIVCDSIMLASGFLFLSVYLFFFNHRHHYYLISFPLASR